MQLALMILVGAALLTLLALGGIGVAAIHRGLRDARIRDRHLRQQTMQLRDEVAQTNADVNHLYSALERLLNVAGDQPPTPPHTPRPDPNEPRRFHIVRNSGLALLLGGLLDWLINAWRYHPARMGSVALTAATATLVPGAFLAVHNLPYDTGDTIAAPETITVPAYPTPSVPSTQPPETPSQPGTPSSPGQPGTTGPSVGGTSPTTPPQSEQQPIDLTTRAAPTTPAPPATASGSNTTPSGTRQPQVTEPGTPPAQTPGQPNQPSPPPSQPPQGPPKQPPPSQPNPKPPSRACALGVPVDPVLFAGVGCSDGAVVVQVAPTPPR